MSASIRRRRDERHEECLELLFALGGKLGEPPRGRCALAGVHGDGFCDSGGAAVVQIRAGISQAPERGRAPLSGRGGAGGGTSAVGLDGLGDAGAWWLTGEDGVCVGVAELRAHVVQQKVGKDAFDVAELAASGSLRSQST